MALYGNVDEEEEKMRRLQDAYDLYIKVQEKGQRGSYYYPDYEMGRSQSINRYAENYQKMLPKQDSFKPASSIDPSLELLKNTRVTSTIPDYYSSFTGGRSLSGDVDTGVSKIMQMIKDVPIPVSAPSVGGKSFGNTTIGSAAMAPLQAVNKAFLGLPEAMGNYALPKTMNTLRGIGEEAPVSNAVGSMIGYVAPFTAASKLAAPAVKGISYPFLKLGAQEGLSGAGVGATEGVIRGDSIGDIADNALDYGLYGAGGGALVGGAQSALKSLQLKKLFDANSITDKDLSSYMINRQSQMYNDALKNSIETPNFKAFDQPQLPAGQVIEKPQGQLGTNVTNFPRLPAPPEGAAKYNNASLESPFINKDPLMLPATNQGYQLTSGADNYGQMVTDPDITRRMKGMYGALQMRPLELGGETGGVINYDPETTLLPRLAKELAVDVPLDLPNRDLVIETLKTLQPKDQVTFLDRLTGRLRNFNQVVDSSNITPPPVKTSSDAIQPPVMNEPTFNNQVPPSYASQQATIDPISTEPLTPNASNNLTLSTEGEIVPKTSTRTNYIDEQSPLSNSRIPPVRFYDINRGLYDFTDGLGSSGSRRRMQAGDQLKGTSYVKIDSDPIDTTLGLNSDPVTSPDINTAPRNPIDPEKLNDYMKIREQAFSGEPRKKYRMWVKNSILNGEVTTPEVKAYWEANLPRLSSISNAETYGIAWEKVTNNLEDSIKEFNSLSHFTNADDVALGEAITVKLMHDGDLVRANEIISDFAVRATIAGQIVQAMSMYKKLSPMGYINFAEKIINHANTVKPEFKIGFKNKNSGKSIFGGGSQEVPPMNNAGTNTNNSASGASPEGVVKALEKKYNLSDADRKQILVIGEQFDALTEAQRNSDMGDELMALRNAIIKKYLKPDLVDKVLALQRINLLLNAKTMVRNVAGNLLYAPVAQTSQAFSAALDAGMNKILGTDRTVFAPTMPYKSLGSGFNKVSRDLKMGIDTSPIATQYELQVGRPDAFQNTWIDNYGKGNNFASKQINNLKWAIGETLRGADAFTKAGLKYGDRPFYEYHYDSVIEGYQKWAKKQAGTDIDYKLIEVPEDFKNLAQLIAKERTFQDMNKTVEAFQGLRDSMNKIAGIEVQRGLNEPSSIGLGNVVLPFTMAPANILKRGLDHTVLGSGTMFKQLFNAAIKNGKYDQYRFVKSVGDQLTGYGMLLFGMWMYKNGYITGDIISDKDAREFIQSIEKKPAYSIKLGGKNYTYDWAQPQAIPIAIGADIAAGLERGQQDSKGLAGVAWQGVSSGVNSLVRQSLLQSIYKLFGGSTQPDRSNVADNVANAFMGIGTQAVPFGSMSRQLSEGYDYVKNGNVKRNLADPNPIYSKLINPIINMTPSRENLPPKLDAWGNIVPQNDTGNPITDLLQTFILPMRVSTPNENGVNLELERLYNESGNVAQFPRYAKTQVTRTKNGITRDTDLTETERNEYQQAFGELSQPRVEKLMKSSMYKAANDNTKTRLISNIYSRVDELLQKRILNAKGK